MRPAFCMSKNSCILLTTIIGSKTPCLQVANNPLVNLVNVAFPVNDKKRTLLFIVAQDRCCKFMINNYAFLNCFDVIVGSLDQTTATHIANAWNLRGQTV